jgi:hypothetical protein
MHAHRPVNWWPVAAASAAALSIASMTLTGIVTPGAASAQSRKGKDGRAEKKPPAEAEEPQDELVVKAEPPLKPVRLRGKVIESGKGYVVQFPNGKRSAWIDPKDVLSITRAPPPAPKPPPAVETPASAEPKEPKEPKDPLELILPTPAKALPKDPKADDGKIPKGTATTATPAAGTSSAVAEPPDGGDESGETWATVSPHPIGGGAGSGDRIVLPPSPLSPLSPMGGMLGWWYSLGLDPRLLYAAPLALAVLLLVLEGVRRRLAAGQ